MFSLSFDPWENPYWVVCVQSKDNQLDKKDVVDVLKIYMPIPDSRMNHDQKASKKVSASLHDDGAGFTVTLPSMTAGMTEENGIKQIHDGESSVDLSARQDVRREVENCVVTCDSLFIVSRTLVSYT